MKTLAEENIKYELTILEASIVLQCLRMMSEDNLFDKLAKQYADQTSEQVERRSNDQLQCSLL